MTSSPKRNVALCYIRLSYTRNEDDANSPERQRANIEAVCQKAGWQMEIYQDTEGHKSGRDVKNRPGWLALSARLGDPDVAALVANDLSRLHRKG
jgi:DNA invertase Pin-like site-specific DNA recombinase